MEIVRGLAFIASNGQAVGVSNEGFILLAGTSFLGVSLPIWVTIICFVVFGVLLNQTVYGRNTLAIGGNPEATRLAGINVERTRVIIFLIQGAIAALPGVILASRITSGQPNAAQGFELNVISACVLGGVSLQGGRATISGVAIARSDYGHRGECHEPPEYRCVLSVSGAGHDPASGRAGRSTEEQGNPGLDMSVSASASVIASCRAPGSRLRR